MSAPRLETPPDAGGPRTDLLSCANPPLALSAAGECLAGALAAGAGLDQLATWLLALGSACLFAAGSLLSHHFRPAPAPSAETFTTRSSRPSVTSPESRAALPLIGFGVALSMTGGHTSGAFAVFAALLAVLYAGVTRRIWGAGVLTMGAARGMNLLLGLSISDSGVMRGSHLFIPVALYVAGWGLLRTSRQAGAPPATGFVGLIHLTLGMSAALFVGDMLRYSGTQFYRLDAAPFVAALFLLVLPRAVRAVMEPRRAIVSEAVQYGFIGLLLFEAALTAGLVGAARALPVAALCFGLYGLLRRWPISIVVGRS